MVLDLEKWGLIWRPYEDELTQGICGREFNFTNVYCASAIYHHDQHQQLKEE